MDGKCMILFGTCEIHLVDSCTSNTALNLQGADADKYHYKHAGRKQS